MGKLYNKTFGVISLGCDKNRVDTEKLLGLLKTHNCKLTDDLSKAQIVIVNTCAFLQSAREEAIQTILECADYKKDRLEKIVVTGCLPQKFIGELFDPLGEADVLLAITKRFLKRLNVLIKPTNGKTTSAGARMIIYLIAF